MKRLLKNVLETTFLEIGRVPFPRLFLEMAISASLVRDKEIENKETVNLLGHRESFHQRPMGHCLANYAWGDASADENIAPCSLRLFRHASVCWLERN